MPKPYAAGKRIDPAKVQAFAELLAGRPCIQAEAYRGADISESSAKRLLKDEGFRAQVERARKQFGGLAFDARQVVRDLLDACDDDGEPAHGLRKMGAELALKYGEQLADPDLEDEATDALPAGVVLLYPDEPGSAWDGEEPAEQDGEDVEGGEEDEVEAETEPGVAPAFDAEAASPAVGPVPADQLPDF